MCVTLTHRLHLNAAQTQTEHDSQSKADPDTLSGFDKWDDMPTGVALFLRRAGASMLEELKKSDASQVR